LSFVRGDIQLDSSRRERIVRFGIIPLVAALAGAVATAMLIKMQTPDPAIDTLKAMLTQPGMRTADRLQIMRSLERLDAPFWTVVEFLSFSLVASWAFLVSQIEGWNRRDKSPKSS
jgi:hypothetical protein